ncbi:MAG: hypothetical protein J5589_02555 [Firmicutes bacterium]|nr:hypothetical protein [Bacillota bacterium]
MSNPNQPQQPQSLRRTINTGLRAQNNNYDKIWYAINYGAYNTLHDTLELGVNSKPDLEREFNDPAEEAKAIEEYKRDNPKTYFSPQEIQELHVPTSRAHIDDVSNVGRLLRNTMQTEERQISTIEEENSRFFELGVVGTKVCHELGKSYRAWQDKLREKDPNDPYIKEKAAYLMFYDTSSQTALLTRGYKEYQQRQAMNLENSQTDLKRQNSIFKDAEALKNMTMGEFCSKAMMSSEQQKAFLEGNQLKNLKVTKDTNAYEFFRQSDRDFKISKGEEQEKDPKKLDQQLAKDAFRLYRKGMRNYQTALGRDFGRSNLPPADRKLVDEGSEFFEMLNYKTPKPIREWAENEGEAMVREDRVQKINDSYRDFSKVIQSKESIGITNDEILSPSFQKNPSKDKFDQYLAKHTGESVRRLPPDQQRKALANAMACASLKDSGKPYDIDTIHTWGKQIMKKNAFQDLKDVEVARYLFNPGTVNNARYKIVNDLYAVPKENQRAYLNEMKSLSQTMYSAKGDSKEYKAMASYVKAIGDMDPDDPGLHDKLLLANEKLRGAIKIYAKGKKSVRTFQDGRDKFDNCLDALSVMNKHVPGMKQDADELVARTNEVRKAKPGQKDFVDLENYGAERARESHLERQLERTKSQVPNEKLTNDKEQIMQF